MKKKWIIYPFICLPLSYVGMSFVQANFDPIEWGMAARVSMLFFSGVATFISIMISELNKDNL